MDATSRSRARRSRRDSIAIESTRTRPSITRSVIHRRPPRAIVGDRARIESNRSRSGRSRDPRRARVCESIRETPYLGDDGGARGDAFLRARGSRRERDQSGVQRQGDHDCVCVTPVVRSSRAGVRSGRGSRAWRETQVYGSGLIKESPSAVPTQSNPLRRQSVDASRSCMYWIDDSIRGCIVW